MAVAADFAVLMNRVGARVGFRRAVRIRDNLAVALADPEEPTSGFSWWIGPIAWAEIYLPGVGWIDFDPTRASVGTTGLVTVAVVRDPRHAIPLHGAYIGLASDFLAMEVHVRSRPLGPLRSM